MYCKLNRINFLSGNAQPVNNSQQDKYYVSKVDQLAFIRTELSCLFGLANNYS